MRKLNNKQFDTKEGASASHSELSHPQLAPSVSQKDENMKKPIVDNFISKSVKMPSYVPAKFVMKKWSEWCIANPSGTYADWKNYLNSLKEGDK